MDRSKASNIVIRNSDLLVFLDDTGHENFTGDQAYYGLGGCILLGSEYPRLINLWQEVRLKIAGDRQAALHAANLPLLDRNFKILRHFFHDRSFLRVAAMVTDATSLPKYMVPADPVMGKLQDEIQAVAAMSRCERVVLVVESSERADPMVRERWGRLVSLDSGVVMPMEHFFMDKRSGEVGLEIADFIVNAAGSQTRRHMRKQNGYALDFADVFCSLPAAGCRFSLIRGVITDANDELVGVEHLRLVDVNADKNSS